MANLVIKNTDPSGVPTPSTGKTAFGINTSSIPFIKDDAGTVTTLGGTGTVTSVGSGTGLTGGPITTSGTLSLANTAVTPGSYTSADITVDAQGRITAASNGTPGGVTSVGGSAPIASSGGATPTISISQATTSTDGYLSSTDWNTFNNKGSGTVTSVSGTAPVVSSGGATPAISMAAATTSVDGYLTSTDWNTFNNKTSNTGTVTSVGVSSTDLTVSGSPITTSGSITLDLATTAVTPASYTYASITVDSKGRITAASNGTTPVTAPAGSTTQVQYNNAGAFGANAGFTYNGTSTLSLGEVTTANSGKILLNSISTRGPATIWGDATTDLGETGMFLLPAEGVAASTTGSNMNIYGGFGYSSGNGVGGEVKLIGGLGFGTGNGGAVTIAGGTATGSGVQGNIGIAGTIVTANGVSISAGGNITAGTWQGTEIAATKGGTGQTSYTTGDILYSSATNTLSKLAAGTNGHVLTLASGVPTWAAGGGGSSPLTTKGDIYTYDTADARLGVGTNGQVLTADSSTATGLKWAAAGGAGGTPPDVQIFTSSGTWTKPASAISVSIFLVGGGGGGGGGGIVITGTGSVSGGAGGGGSSTTIFFNIDESLFSSTESVTIGAGGAGGTSVSSTTTNTNGNAGTAGGNTSFSIFNSGNGGGGGGGVVGGNASGGAIGSGGTYNGTAGAGSNQIANASFAGSVNSLYMGVARSGGGAGGSAQNTAVKNATPGGAVTGAVSISANTAGVSDFQSSAAATGTNGDAGTFLVGGPINSMWAVGGAGGGGASSQLTTATGGNGGAGIYGSGGGGGGAAKSANGASALATGGEGGAGGDGYAIIVTYF